MADSRQLVIQNRLVAALQIMTKQAGYHFDVQQVTKKFLSIGNVNSFPVALVLRGPWRTEPADETGSNLRRTTVVFGIVGYVSADEDGSAEGKLNDACDQLEEDIRRALYEQEAAILVEADIESMEVEQGESILADDETRGAIQLMATIVFTHLRYGPDEA